MGLLSGCAGVTIKSTGRKNEEPDPSDRKVEVALAAESDYFETVEMHRKEAPFPFGDEEEMQISLKPNPPKTVSAVILMVGGEQGESTSINTGETSAALEVYFEDDPNANRNVELLAVQGGEESFHVWEGGEILERVPVTVEISE